MAYTKYIGYGGTATLLLLITWFVSSAHFSVEYEGRDSKGRFKKGHKLSLNPWHKGRTGVYSQEALRKIGEKSKGRKIKRCNKCNCFIGKTEGHDCIEIAKKISKKLIGRIVPKEIGKKISMNAKINPNYSMKGKKHSKKTKKLISLKNKGKHFSSKTELKKGKDNPNWQGGISFEPYGLKFNKELKEQIRKRDNYTCQECGYEQEQLGYKLLIHHIDYDKQNNHPSNLISLCRGCHGQTNFKRNDWTSYFQNKMESF